MKMDGGLPMKWDIKLKPEDNKRDLADANLIYMIFKGVKESETLNNGNRIGVYNRMLRVAIQDIWLNPRSEKAKGDRRPACWPWSEEARDVYFGSIKNGRPNSKVIANNLVMEHVIKAKSISEKIFNMMEKINNKEDMFAALKELHKNPYAVVITKIQHDIIDHKEDGWKRYENCKEIDINRFKSLLEDERYADLLGK